MTADAARQQCRKGFRVGNFQRSTEPCIRPFQRAATPAALTLPTLASSYPSAGEGSQTHGQQVRSIAARHFTRQPLAVSLFASNHHIVLACYHRCIQFHCASYTVTLTGAHNGTCAHLETQNAAQSPFAGHTGGAHVRQPCRSCSQRLDIHQRFDAVDVAEQFVAARWRSVHEWFGHIGTKNRLQQPMPYKTLVKYATRLPLACGPLCPCNTIRLQA